MIIGIDANEANLTNQRVGVNQYAFDLLQAIYSETTEHQFVIYLKSPPLADLPLPRLGWNYRVIPFPKLWTQTRLPWDLYTHNPKPDVFLSLTHYAPRFSPIPSVVTIMDLGFLKTPEQFTTKDFNQLKSWTSYSIRQAKKIISISEYTKSDILKNFHKKSADVIVSYPSYDEKMFKYTKDLTVLNKYQIKTPYILFLSSLKPSKNIEGLINAFNQLKDKKISLVIAGKKGWLYETIFKLVTDLKLQNRVIFTGFVEEKEKPVLMSHSECFILPSFYEGFGIPVLEAMACGTPVVAANVTSLPEVLGDAGVYVDPYTVDSIADGIAQAITNRSKFAQLGLKRVKSFSWAKSAKEVISVLESTV